MEKVVKGKAQIDVALAKAGIRRSDVTRYRFKDEYGTSALCAPRTQSLRRELEIIFDDPDYRVLDVRVNALREVVIEYVYDLLKNRR